jgi:hypothetical protein
MFRTGRMSQLSTLLAKLQAQITLPEDVAMAVDIDPVSLA